MLNRNKNYFCNICKENIPITEKTLHKNICTSSNNNNISNNSFEFQINNINKKEIYMCPICKDEINIKEKEVHQELHLCNDFYINNEIGNEETFNNEGILVSRNILSNHNSQDLLDDNNSNLYDDGINSYSDDLIIKNKDFNKIIEKYNVNRIDDINNFYDKKCIICLEQFKKGDNYIILPCMHFFHGGCIKKWININNRCPFCNLEIN